MVEANLIKYVTDTVTDTFFPAIAVYVPSEKIFVRKDGHTDLISGPVNQMYESLVGKEAERSYQELLEVLRKKGYKDPKTIEVTEEFVNWAKAVHQVRNPSQEISDLLSTF